MLQKREFACTLFDPLFLKDKEGGIEVLRNNAEELLHFECAQFNDNFIEDLKKEIPLDVEHANR